MQEIYDINNHGQIIGRSAAEHGVLLTPASTERLPQTGDGSFLPAAGLVGAMVLGLGVLLRRWERRAKPRV